MATVRTPDLLALKLEEQVRELRAALENADEAICRVDLDGLVVSVNRAYARLFGGSADELVGRPWQQSVVPSERAAVAEALRAPSGQRVEREVHGVRRDGVVFEMQLTVVAIDGASAPGTIGPVAPAAGAGAPAVKAHYFFIRDLTDRRRMENQLIFAGRMAAVGTLAAGVAHDINNPLAYIVANIDFTRQQMALLGGRADGGHGGADGGNGHDTRRAIEEVNDALAEARQGAERVRNIVRDLRVFARGDEDAHGPVALRRVLDSSINMAWNEIRHRARLVKDYRDVPLVDGNESRLGQVFLNLLLNAAQAIGEGEAERHEIRVSTRTDQAGRAVVEVRDTGRGIPAEIRARIFDPFFTTKPAGEGTGLGLWIVQGILNGFGGDIAVESDVGRGSLFRVTLPAVAMEPATDRAAAPPAEGVALGARLLIVDDEPMILGALRRALAGEFQVTCESEGRRALEHLRSGERYDVILCDLMMPELTGMDLYAEMGRLAPDQRERVVFVTGGAFTPRAREFLERVPNARVEKPIDFQNLRIMIRNLLR